VNSPGAQRGFILMSVVVAITLLAAIAFMLGYQGASQTGIASGELERDRLRYIAEAGMAHAKLQLANNTSCSGYTDIPKTDFGGDSYSVEFPNKSSSPVRIRAIGELQGGGKFKLQSDSVQAYQAPLAVNLQLSKTGGKDAILDDFYPIRNYGGANYLQVNSASWQQRPVLQFDLSEVPAGVKILSAHLELMQQSVNNGGAVAVHRMTREWVEGTKNGGGIADGATWQTHDGSGAWLQQGGEFDATVYGVTQVSGAKSGNWVAWEIRDLVQEWVSGTAPNFGLMLAGDGTVTGAQYASKDTSGAEQAPKLTIAYACECGKTCAGAPVAGKNVLLVVGDTANLTVEQTDKKALMEGWGHTVSLIATSASQAEFDLAADTVDVIYIPELGTTPMSELGDKADNLPKGVITEEARTAIKLGGFVLLPFVDTTSINILDNTHYITETLPTGNVTLSTASQSFWKLGGTLAPDLHILGELTGGVPGLAFVDVGETLNDGSPAAGRRVKLPWGSYNFDVNLLTDDGLDIMQRAIEWGADAPIVANDGWAVGDSGSIYYTADAGATWTPQTSGTAQSLYSVLFPTPTVGYAAGTGEVLLKTTDGGNAWSTLSTGTQSLWALDFLDANTGYTVGIGATVKMTTDGGSNWANQDPVTTQNLRHIDFVDASTGYLAGLGGVVRKTSNGGTSWSVQNSGVTTALYSIDFTNAATGWAVGDLGVIVKTTDGGASWNPQASGTSNKLQSVAAIDSSTAIAVGRVGLILRTTDGGSSWVTQTSGTTGDLWYVHFVDATTGYVTGQNGEILKTTDGGATWTSTDLGTSVTMRAIFFAKNGAAGPATGPIAHWKLDDGTGLTAIDSEGGHDGLLVSGTWTTGTLGGALDFNGSTDYVLVADDPALDITEAITLMAWVKPNKVATQYFFKKAISGGTDGYELALSTSGKVVFRLNQNSQGDSYRIDSTTSYPFDGSTWMHVAATYDGAVQRLYINGGEEVSNPASITIGTNDTALSIGAQADGIRMYDGTIDEVRIYNRALSAAEISDLFTAGGGGGGGGGGGSCDGTYLDQFEVYEFDNSDGTLDWSASPWQEIGESDGPTAGDIRIWSDLDSVRFRTRDNDNGGEGLEREADMSGAATATLSYDYRRDRLDSSSDYTTVEVSANGAAGPWTELARYAGPNNDNAYITVSHDIGAFIASNTRIRFKTSSSMGGLDHVWFDNVEITCAP